MATRTYIVASRTYRLGRVVEIGEAIQLDEELADGDDTLVKLPDEAADTTNTQGAPSGIADAEPRMAEPEPNGGAQATGEADASLAPETGEADGRSGRTAAAPPADQAAETKTKSKAKKAD